LNKADFMVAVTAIIENDTGEILLIKRCSEAEYPNCWEDVGGRLKQSESPEEGLRREIKEETGIEDIEIVKPLTVFHVYRNNTKNKENELIGIAYWCKTKTTEIVLSNEHTDYQWLSPKEAIDVTEHPALMSYLRIQMAEKQLSERVIFNDNLGDVVNG